MMLTQYVKITFGMGTGRNAKFVTVKFYAFKNGLIRWPSCKWFERLSQESRLKIYGEI